MMEEIMETCTINNNKIEYNYLVIFNMQPCFCILFGPELIWNQPVICLEFLSCINSKGQYEQQSPVSFSLPSLQSSCLF